jgi:hypothetical protein
MSSTYEEKSEVLQASFLQSLKFSAMRHRHEAVAEAHKATFKWIFEDAEAYAFPWSNFVDWLHHGDGVYWINGKAASGKSTLMRFIVDNPMTVYHLKQWSNGEALDFEAFFFWNSGSLEQRSYTGLLKSLLYEILNRHRNLIRLVFPLEWTEDFCQMTRWHSPDRAWSLSALKKAFARLTTFDIAPLKLCFFIDGLDEYEGDHEEMAKLLKQVALSPQVKFCLSSRPWITFEEEFRGLPMLRLQDLTVRDIKAYVADKLEGHSQMHTLSQKEPKRASELVTEIVTKASGVFLWVVLVVRDLLKGLRNRDDISDLQKRLQALPSELEDLYTHMLGHVDPLYQEQASRTFQIFRILSENSKYLQTDEGGGLLTPLFLDVAITSTQETVLAAKLKPMSREEVIEKSQHLDRHLKSRCEGLLEIHSSGVENLCADLNPYYYAKLNPHYTYARRVDYLHRTVRNFLESEPVKTRMVQHTATTDFDPHISIMMALIIRLKQFLFNQELVARDRNLQLEDLARPISLVSSLATVVENKRNSKYIELLDESDRVGTLWAQHSPYCESSIHSFNHWSDYDKIEEQQGIGFLSEAVRFGLFSYVSTKLEANRAILSQSKANNVLIIHALIPMGRSLDETVVCRPKMIELLFRYGANPNQLFGGHTPWQRFLTWTHRSCGKDTYTYHSRHKEDNYEDGAPPDPYRNPDFSYLHLWSSLFRKMLLNGASTTTTCTKNHKLHNGPFTTRHQVLDVIDDIFGRFLPEDALALKQLVEASRDKFETQGSNSGSHSILASGKRRLEFHEMGPRKKLERAISDFKSRDQHQ